MAWYNSVKDVLVKVKDIVTTIAGFIPLVFVVIDTFNTWAAGGDANVANLLMALAVAIVGWFTGKGKAVVK